MKEIFHKLSFKCLNLVRVVFFKTRSQNSELFHISGWGEGSWSRSESTYTVLASGYFGGKQDNSPGQLPPGLFLPSQFPLDDSPQDNFPRLGGNCPRGNCPRSIFEMIPKVSSPNFFRPQETNMISLSQKYLLASSDETFSYFVASSNLEMIP
jgi:hypothetical protein